MIGWANYFCLGPVSKAYRAVESHARNRLRQWLGAKHKQRGGLGDRYPDKTLHERWGVVRLTEWGWAASQPTESRKHHVCSPKSSLLADIRNSLILRTCQCDVMERTPRFLWANA